MTSKKNGFVLTLALALTGFISAVDAFTVSPILDILNSHFSEFSYAVTSLIGTVSTVSVAIASLITAIVCGKLGRKKTLLIGILLCALGGTSSAFFDNFYLLLATRLIEGFGAGLAFNTGLIMIPYVFNDEEKINKVFGLTTALSSIAGMIISTVSGYLGMINWKYSFYLYAVGIVLFFIDLAVLPEIKDDGAAASIKPTGAGLKHALLTFMFSVVSTIYFIDVAAFIAEAVNGTSAQAGIVSAVITFVTFVMGLVFGKVYGGIGRFTPMVSFIFMALGAAVPLFIPSMTTIYLGAVLFGIGYGTYYPYISAEVAEFSAPENMDANMSWMNVGYYIGQIACSFFMGLLVTIFKSESAFTNYWAMLIIFALLAVIYLIDAAAKKTKA